MLRRSLIVLGALGLILCKQGPKITTKSREALKLFERAEEKIDNMLIADALPDLEKAVELDSGFALAWSRLSGVYQSLGKETKAKEALDKSKELAPKVTEYEQLRISIREAGVGHDYEKVFDLVKQMAEKYPEDKRAQYVLGSQLYFKNRRKEAIKSLNKALEIDSNYAPVYNMLGYTYASMGKYEDALKSLKRYVDLLPDHPNPHDSYGEVLLTMGRYDEAISEFKKADSLKPGVFFVLEHLGHTYRAQGKYREAVDYYKKALETAISDAAKGDVHFEMGVAALAMDDYETAKREAELCQALDPERPCPHYTKMEIYLRKGELGKAKAEAEILEKKLAKYSENIEEDRFYLQTRARIAYAQGQYDKAIELYKKALIKAGAFEVVDSHYALAEVYFDKGDLGLAIKELENALKINPNDARTRLLLGKVFEKKGDITRAETEFTKVLEILSTADEGVKEVKEAKRCLGGIKKG